MKKILILTVALALVMGCKDEAKKSETTPDGEAKQEQQVTTDNNGWVDLFDGATLKGWHGYNGDKVSEAWKVEDGSMVFYPPAEREEGERFNLVTDKEFVDFVLSLEWKISEGGNSGIFWGVVEDEAHAEPYFTGPEMQVLDNAAHPDAKVAGGSHTAGALYDMVIPSKDVTRPAGEWNTYEITIDYANNIGKVVLNGIEIVSFKVKGEEWEAMVAKSKFADWEAFGKSATGKIGLQDHGDIVSYRNIRIKEL